MEEIIVNGVKHEELSLLLMRLLNEQFNGKLDLAIDIFTNNYSRKFFHELVSGQIDMDRMDYLRRDSFFTGVIEGSVGSDRIINMLNVVDDTLVIEEKGIYSIEKFLIARRLMYWQVYMHKTVMVAENILTSMFNRAKELVFRSVNLFSTPQLSFFMERDFSLANIHLADNDLKENIANNFVTLNDSDILVAAKYWSVHDDKILSDLSSRLLKRELFAIELQNFPFEDNKVEAIEKMVMSTKKIDVADIDYYVSKGEVYNRIYSPEVPDIKILAKNGEVNSILAVSDMFDFNTIRLKKSKNFICYPKECRLN